MKKDPPPYELIRWQLAEKFGWSLEYVDTLSMGDISDYFEVMDGYNKGIAYLRRVEKRE